LVVFAVWLCWARYRYYIQGVHVRLYGIILDKDEEILLATVEKFASETGYGSPTSPTGQIANVRADTIYEAFVLPVNLSTASNSTSASSSSFGFLVVGIHRNTHWRFKVLKYVDEMMQSPRTLHAMR
jgi:hypothetical protein